MSRAKRIVVATLLVAIGAVLHWCIPSGNAQQTQSQLLSTIATNVPSGSPSVLTAASLRAALDAMTVSSTGGVDQNIANIQNSTNYTIQPSDCGKTVQMGGGFFITTLPAVSPSFISNCTVIVKNANSGAGVGLSGFPSDLPGILYPTRSLTVKIVNGAWNTTASPGRWPLTANTTINIDNVSGSDSNDGLASGSGRALASFNAAVTAIAKYWDTQGFTVTIQAASSQSWSNLTIAQDITGGGIIRFDGGGGTVTASGGANGLLIGLSYTPTLNGNSYFQIQNMTFACSGGGGNEIEVSSGTLAINTGITFSTCTGGGGHILIDSNSGRLVPQTGYAVTGGGGFHGAAIGGGLFDINNAGLTITITGSPSFSTAFVEVNDLGIMIFYATISGSINAGSTGWVTFRNGIIDTNGTSCNTKFGGVAGSNNLGGQCG